MPSFNDIAKSAGIRPPTELDLSDISAPDISEITSEVIQDYLADLYDNKGVRGVVFARHKDYIISVLECAKQGGYIDDVPQIKLRTEEHIIKYNKPDRTAIEQILAQTEGQPVETIIRLAWECGLARAEIPTLKYDQIDFKNAEIVLPDRKVPIPSATLQFFKELRDKNQAHSDYVLISQKKEAPMAEQSVSRLVRYELDKYGQKEVRLSDLRMDFIVNCLRDHSIEYVSYVSGVNMRSLRAQYLPYVEAVPEAVSKATAPDHEAVYRLMVDEQDSVTGLALWFVWQLGMTVTELPQLTWDMVDFNSAKIDAISIPDELLILLRGLKEKNEKYSDHIFLTDSTNKPLDREYITKIVKKAFVKNGFIDLSLSELRKNFSPEMYGLKKELTAYLEEHRYADCKTVAAALNITEKNAGKLLRQLKSTGEVVLVGRRYFLPGTVVSPEEQESTILNYVKDHPLATRKELSELLGLASRRQFLPIVEPLIEEGKLIRTTDNKYCLP